MELRTGIAKVLFAASLAIAPLSFVHAGEAANNARASNANSATASVGFRITIKEVLRSDGQMQRMNATASATTRTLSTENDRQVITYARP